KDSNAEGKLLEQLNEWLVENKLHEELNCYQPPYKSQGTSLSQCIMQRNSSDYILATREALAFLDYLRRFADSLSKESQ
ncbi:MAG TPA: type III-B CRISPR module-associated protein Cmr5, partial [Smithellaceae bacterium]|nr:type III-B CRISPR module-associated protein Cmr5 [Smithellaceae bacterium]